MIDYLFNSCPRARVKQHLLWGGGLFLKNRPMLVRITGRRNGLCFQRSNRTAVFSESHFKDNHLLYLIIFGLKFIIVIIGIIVFLSKQPMRQRPVSPHLGLFYNNDRQFIIPNYQLSSPPPPPLPPTTVNNNMFCFGIFCIGKSTTSSYL